MPAAFLYENLVPGAALSAAGATVATMPLSNLQDTQPRIRARFPGTTAAIVADLLSPSPVGVVALVGTTAGQGATIRLRLSLTDPSGVAGEVLDTGVQPAEARPESQGQVVLVLAADLTARFLRVDLVDGAAAQVDVGLLAAGPPWRMSRAIRYGSEEGRLLLDQRARNLFTGAEFPVRAVTAPRFARFAVEALSTTEARDRHRAMLARLGAAVDALWIPDTALTQAEMNARCLWGAAANPGELVGIARAGLRTFGRNWTMVERI
jgi:hypothetical protein